MDTSNILNLIKESFETWYNKAFPEQHPSAIAINYSDTQNLAMKAIHTVTMEVQAIGIKEGKSFCTPLLTLTENYNHGITSEIEAKAGLLKRLLIELYSFKR